MFHVSTLLPYTENDRQQVFILKPTKFRHGLVERFKFLNKLGHSLNFIIFQVVRKRHIGNDIVTVIFQEPGSVAFTPAHFRSHYQHVFVVVRVSNPCTPDTTYQ